MAEIEDAIADGVVEELGAGAAPTAQPGMGEFHAGPGTTPGLHGGSGTMPGGAVVGLHEGTDTRPLEGFYGEPAADDEGPNTMEKREAAYAAAVEEKRLNEAAAQASLRWFRSDPVVSHGYVPGLEFLEKRTRK